MSKAGAAKLRVLLPILGLACFVMFQFLKSDYDQSPSARDVNTFLRRRLSELAESFDDNGDGALSDEEVLFWYHTVDVGDKAAELKSFWEVSDRNSDNVIDLAEYMSYMGFLAEDPSIVRETVRRFASADRDKSTALDREEFAIFIFPELSPDMRQHLYEEEMAERDINEDGYLSLYEYLGMSEEEFADRTNDRSLQQNIHFFRTHLDTDHDGNLSPPEILAWVSDDKRHLREKSDKLVEKFDRNKDGVLGIQTEILSDVKYFSEHELTRYGDLLFYQEEL